MEEMEARQKAEKHHSLWRRIITWRPGKAGAVVLLVLIILGTVLIVNNLSRMTLGHFSRAIQYSRLGSPGHAEELRFTNLGSNTFATLGDGIAVASSGGLRFYDRSGALAYSAALEMERPVIRSEGEYVLAYDLGGYSFQSGNRQGARVHMETWEGRIIDANINANGWITLSTEQIGTLGVVVVIDPQGNQRYRVEIRSGHVVGAVLAEDNRTLAILTMADTGGRVLWYSTDVAGQPPQAEYLHEDELFFDIWTTTRDGSVGVISNNMVLILSPGGTVVGEYQFRARNLRAYDIEDGYAALYFPNGAAGEIVLLNRNGSDRRIEVEGNVTDLSLRGRYLGVLFGNELLVFRGTSRYASFRDTEGMTNVQMREDGTVFRLSAHRAILLVP